MAAGGAPLPAAATPGAIVSPAPLQLVAGGERLVPVVAGSRTSFVGTFLWSRDGGRTWSTAVSPPMSVESVAMVDALDGRRWWLIARHTVLSTSDAGLHWTSFACRPLLRTRDGGRTWQMASPDVA